MRRAFRQTRAFDHVPQAQQLAFRAERSQYFASPENGFDRHNADQGITGVSQTGTVPLTGFATNRNLKHFEHPFTSRIVERPE